MSKSIPSWRGAAGLPLVLLGFAACSQGTGGPPEISHVKPLANANVGLGFDPGVDLLAEGGGLEDELGLTGALLPAPTGSPARRVGFVAFTSDIDASTLDRNAAPPADANAAADVFLAAVLDTRVDVNGTPQPAAFNQAMINAFRHIRCIKCHGFHFEGGFGDTGTAHPGGESEQKNEICLNCHDAGIGLGESGEPIEWRAPLLAEEGEITFEGKTPFVLCNQVIDNVDDPVEHFGNDTRIFWAMENAIVPTGTVAPGGPVPFRKAHFDELVEAWVQGGLQCTTADAVKDVALASRTNAGGGAGNAASRRPSVTFVHNPVYDPDDALGTNVAGWVYVAFESEATNIVPGFFNNNAADPDVFRTRIQVRVDENPLGAFEAGALHLVPEPGQNVLISRSTAGATQSGNGRSSRPAIDATGAVVAFESTATNLVAGFANMNGTGSDVYVRNQAVNVTALVSRSFGSAGGNGSSGAPALSRLGDAVAFETLADDLDFADTNGVQDVYFASVNPATTAVLALFRASVRTGGVQATGGDSRRPAVFVDETTGDVSVLFESDKTDLAGPGTTGLPATNVYLYQGPIAPVTTLLSQVSTATTALVPDGSSGFPAVSPDGRWAAYQTTATNLDTVRLADTNGAVDVMLLDLAAVRATGDVEGKRLSVGAEGVDGQGTSTEPRLASFITTLGDYDTQGLAAYRTLAENLGISTDPVTGAPLSDRNLAFLVE